MGSTLVTPTPAQVEWADCEIGVIIHFDIPTFEPSYSFRDQWGYHPSPDIFTPTELNTDQWLAAAQAAGATYAVLVAKHCSGFCLWPSRAHDYTVAGTPWRNGKGNIVADFFRSCEKTGIRPGLYYSSSCNAFCNVDNPGTVRNGDADAQARYNDVVMTQLTELWTDYGKLFEIWFDGGTLPPSQGGPDIAGLLHRLQSQAVVFQGPPQTESLLRWVGNERGEAPYPCWATTDILTREGGTVERLDLAGSPDGAIWAPAESDMPNRDQKKAYRGGWFWREGDDQYLYSVDHLMERYYTSVGRNSNLLLGMVIDTRGLVPDADMRQFAEFGKRVRTLNSRTIAETSGTGAELILSLPSPCVIDHAILMEDITGGERVRSYAIDARTDGDWCELRTGSCIGHKRIERFDSTPCDALRLRCLDSIEEPQIRSFKALG